MRLALGFFAAIPAALLLTGAGGSRAHLQSAAGAWRTDWEKARVEARQASKPLFVVFR